MNEIVHMGPDDEILNIIVKKIKGEITSEESERLSMWLESDSANPFEYEGIVRIFKDSTVAVKNPSFNTEAAWNKIEGSIKVPVEVAAEPGKVFYFLYWKRMTVAIALMASIITGWYLWHRNTLRWQSFNADQSNLSLKLPDGSNVLIRKGGSIRYPEIFNDRQRIVKLSGEAYFDVQHDEKNPFIIYTSHAEIKVLGTSFLVNSKEDLDEVIVVKGRVSVSAPGSGSRAIILTDGNKTVLKGSNFQDSRVMDSNYLAWKTGLLDFKGTQLSKVVSDVQNYFDLPIEIDEIDKKIAEYVYVTARFENQSFDQVLEEIRLATGWKTRKEAEKIIFFTK